MSVESGLPCGKVSEVIWARHTAGWVGVSGSHQSRENEVSLVNGNSDLMPEVFNRRMMVPATAPIPGESCSNPASQPLP